jgi:LuxR family maltose regulon positive regulatory protein
MDRLARVADVPVVLVSAPAGYGKTTLLSLWGRQDGRAFAWVTLDGADNDPILLVGAVLAALDPLADLDPSIAEMLRSPEPPLDDIVLPALVDACTAMKEPFVVVLDDVHLVNEPRCHGVIRYVAEHLPPGCQLALATRTDPPLPLASWRAHGRLVELRAPDLALGLDEAVNLFNVSGVPLAADQVARLVERTEGWSAALYLAALSLRDRLQRDEFVDRFAGTTRHVAEFLSEDVLARLPDDLISFLLHTCVVEDLNVSLCDALTGSDDAGTQLPALERSNLFVVPLDEERTSYRYHHLFVEFLRAELGRRDRPLIAELHRRAWVWYRDHGIVGRAVAHAQAAGDIDVAAALVSGGWLAMVESGQVETTRSWMAGFTDDQIRANAPLSIAAAWVAALAGDGENAMRFAAWARAGVWDGPMPDGTASLESALAIMSSAFGSGGVSAMEAEAQLAVDLQPTSDGWRSLALLLLGVAQTLQEEFADATATLEEAVELSGGETSTATTSLAYLAFMSLRQGELEHAWRYASRAHAVVERLGMRNYMPSICTYTMVAHLADRRGDPEGAAAALDRVQQLLPRLTPAYWWQMIVTRILVAPVLANLGRTSDAEGFLKEADQLLAQHPDAGTLPDWYDEAFRALRPSRRRSPPSQALTDAERRVLQLLAGDLTLREIGRELFLSRNTVRTHVHSIYRKLGVSSRADAVKAAPRSAPKAKSPG